MPYMMKTMNSKMTRYQILLCIDIRLTTCIVCFILFLQLFAAFCIFRTKFLYRIFLFRIKRTRHNKRIQTLFQVDRCLLQRSQARITDNTFISYLNNNSIRANAFAVGWLQVTRSFINVIHWLWPNLFHLIVSQILLRHFNVVRQATFLFK